MNDDEVAGRREWPFCTSMWLLCAYRIPWGPDLLTLITFWGGAPWLLNQEAILKSVVFWCCRPGFILVSHAFKASLFASPGQRPSPNLPSKWQQTGPYLLVSESCNRIQSSLTQKNSPRDAWPCQEEFLSPVWISFLSTFRLFLLATFPFDHPE